MNYLDLGLIALLAWGAWRGFRHGFARLLAGWISYLVGGLVAVLYTRPLAEAIDQATHLSIRWASWLAGFLPFSPIIKDQPLSRTDVSQVETLLNNVSLPETVKQGVLNNLHKFSDITIDQALAGQLIFLALELICAVMLFYSTVFILHRLTGWIAGGGTFTHIGLVNRMLGLVLGLAGQAVFLAVAVGLLRNLIALPAMTSAPGLLSFGRQLYSSEIAVLLWELYDWLVAVFRTFI